MSEDGGVGAIAVGVEHFGHGVPGDAVAGGFHIGRAAWEDEALQRL